MASFASSATTCGARKHAWTKITLWLEVGQAMENLCPDIDISVTVPNQLKICVM